jgi:alkylated DNA repair dioxygenase AlkB
MNVEYGRLFSESLAAMVFFTLEREVKYLEDQKICVFGNYFEIPRKHAAFGDAGLKYEESGLTMYAKAWTPVMGALRDCVSKAAGEEYNFVIVNRFETGKETLGFQSLESKGLDKNSSVAFLSLGAARSFTYRNKGYLANQSFTLRVESGSLVLSLPPTTECFLHGIPYRPAVSEPHINLTFVRLDSKRGAEKKRLGSFGSCCSAI